MPKQADPGSIATLDPSDQTTRAAVATLLAQAEAVDDHPALSEPSRLAWDANGPDLLGLVLSDSASGSASVVGYAQLSWRDRSWTVEVVVDPESPERSGARAALLEAARSTARQHGAAELRYWVNRYREDERADAAPPGFTFERDLLQMRVPLPLTIERRPLDPAFSLRAFRPGRDEAAWLEVNNRAFAAHPEQGHWNLETLLDREQTDWFDPDGFLLCESSGELAGSCWTKVHRDRRPALGEIYVISVDPGFQQRGLGRVLTVAGLDWLAERVSVGMLYVDASNVGAVALYRSLGFEVDHVDRCYLLSNP